MEERGLDTVGIYRVPGNSANVNYLTEQVSPSSISYFSFLLKQGLSCQLFKKTSPDIAMTDNLQRPVIKARPLEEITNNIQYEHVPYLL